MKTILIDLDGVLNEYRGNFDANNIPKPKCGADKFLKKLSESFDLKLFTNRNKLNAAKWLFDNKFDTYFSDITDVKEPAWLYIDDRCIKFEGDYCSLLEQIHNFQVWYK